MMKDAQWFEKPRRHLTARICDLCGFEENITVGTVKKNHSTDFCKKCVLRATHTGKPMSDQTKEKLSLAKLGKKLGPRPVEYIDRYLKGSNNAFFGMHHTDESKSRMLASRQQNGLWEEAYYRGLATRDNQAISDALKGRQPVAPYQKKYVYASHTFRSSWELGYAIWLDKQGISWTYEPITLILSTGCSYTPDFLHGNTMVEIKGGFYTDDAKYLLAKDEFPQYQWVIYKLHDLQNMGILKHTALDPSLIDGVYNCTKHKRK